MRGEIVNFLRGAVIDCENDFCKMIVSKSDEGSAELAANILLQKKIAVLPTDTVYGFSGIVCREVEKKIRAVKGRGEAKPFIRLIAEPCDIALYADGEIPSQIFEAWPGALTLIVRGKAGEGTVAYRCPGDAWLRKIIKLCGTPIYSTSANKSGSPVLSRVADIAAEFADAVDLLVADGDKTDALPSTIVSVADGALRVVRQGAVRVQI